MTDSTMNLPSGESVGIWLGAAVAAFYGIIRLRAYASRDDLTVKENKSRGDWIVGLERRAVAAESQVRAAAEQRLKDIEKMALMQSEISELRHQVADQDDDLKLIKRLLIKARPDLEEMFAVSTPGKL